MSRAASPDYGRCPCSGDVESRTVEVRLRVDGELVTVPEVPQGFCPSCGSRLYKAETLERIEELMKGQREDLRLEREIGERFSWP